MDNRPNSLTHLDLPDRSFEKSLLNSKAIGVSLALVQVIYSVTIGHGS
jgi:hypothetical protein